LTDEWRLGVELGRQRLQLPMAALVVPRPVPICGGR
jgi:hypothetical protein